MEAVYEHSMMKRYLEKEVHERLVLDDMATDRGWRHSGIGEMHYTAEIARTGSRSLEVRVPFRDEEYLRAHSEHGSLTCSQGGRASVSLHFDPPQDWTPFNRISFWVYVHPSTMHSYAFNLAFNCEGCQAGPVTPLSVHFVQDLEPGRWNHIVWEIPDLQRDRVTSFHFGQLLRGHGPEEGGIVTYNIDRVELQKVDCEHYRGWEVAPGRISFSHVGYRPTGRKVALAAGTGADEFELILAANRESVARLAVERIENERGRFEVLDFSGFMQPGRYLLRCGGVESQPFDIRDDVWYGTIEKVLNFYYGQRCGFPVPGVHGVCHADLRGRRDDEMKVINGGWHDAGDLSQGSFRTGPSLYGMLRNYAELCRRDAEPTLRDRLLEEIRWGLDWLLKTRFGDGYRITWYSARIYTDNEIGTFDDTIAKARNVPFENFLFAGVAAYAAQVLGEADPERAEQALEAAAEDYRATMDGREDWSDATRDEAAYGALAAVQLYRATGDEAYADDAVEFGRLLLGCQEQTFVDGIPIAGYFYRDTSRTRVVHDHHMSFESVPMTALEALCGAFPEHSDWMEWYGAALVYSQFFQAPGARVSAPYYMLASSVWSRAEAERMAESCRERGQDPDAIIRQYEDGTEIGDGYCLRVFPIWPNNRQHGGTGCQLASTVALSAAARMRNSLELQELAASQFQWVLGANPFSQSLMYGEGYDFQPLFAYCMRDMVGALPVGMDCMASDEPWWTCFNDSDYKEIWVVPTARFLEAITYVATPARVEGTAAAHGRFIEHSTGKWTEVSGDFAVDLPPGQYVVECGTMQRRVDLLAGSNYTFRLDPADWIGIVLFGGEARTDGCVEVRATVRGAGEHTLELRALNGTLDASTAHLDLGAEGEETLTWDLKVAHADRPWAVVAIPDGDHALRAEAFGAPHSEWPG
jgi:hypothetical protein